MRHRASLWRQGPVLVALFVSQDGDGRLLLDYVALCHKELVKEEALLADLACGPCVLVDTLGELGVVDVRVSARYLMSLAPQGRKRAGGDEVVVRNFVQRHAWLERHPSSDNAASRDLDLDLLAVRVLGDGNDVAVLDGVAFFLFPLFERQALPRDPCSRPGMPARVQTTDLPDGDDVPVPHLGQPVAFVELLLSLDHSASGCGQ
mmetsp:Transcript_116925/g.310960  ORF Transcript_116925/g.310960 Transcript_116925/m.310960 type:complete len:205 (+) Transcript_116925:679-1293(+)